MTLDSKPPFVKVLAQALTEMGEPARVGVYAEAEALIAALPPDHNPDVLRAEVERLRGAINFTAIPTIAVFAPENSGAKIALNKLRALLTPEEASRGKE